MLLGLFGKKTDHPMADVASAQELLNDFPKNDSHKMLMELTEWIESVSDNADFKLDNQFGVLRLLDETAQPYARKLTREYFTPQELTRFHENRMWLALGNLASHTARGYMTVFRRYCNGDKGASVIKPLLPLLTARMVHAMTMQMKYVCAHYGQTDKEFWANVAQILRHAEHYQYLDTPVSLYPGSVDSTSLKSQLGLLLGWCGCGVSSLSPLQLHLTERLVAQHSSGVDVCVQLKVECLFSFDLDHPSVPRRLKVGSHSSDSMRFVSMLALRPKLEALAKVLVKGVVPEGVNLGGVYDAEPVRQAVNHLLEYLTGPPLRRSSRREVKVNLNVVNGFAGLVERTSVGLNFSETKPALWEVQDISAHGFRIVLPTTVADSIRIGGLLGIQPEGMAYWGVAVIRRMRRDEENLLHVGVEMLSGQIDGILLSQSGGGGGAFENGQPALWLQAKPEDLPGEAWLLMKSDAFSLNRSLQTQLNGKNYLLIPVKLQEKGMDYDLAKFRVIEQESRLEE